VFRNQDRARDEVVVGHSVDENAGRPADGLGPLVICPCEDGLGTGRVDGAAVLREGEPVVELYDKLVSSCS